MDLLPAFLILAGASSVLGDVLTDKPSADSEIRQFSATSNFGTGTTMVSGGLGAAANHEIRRVLLRFDLAGKIPANAQINSVTLRVRVAKVPNGAVNSTFGLFRVLQPWTETGVSWNARGTGSSWSPAGVSGAGDVNGTASGTVAIAGLAQYTFPSSSALVADVQAWVADPQRNHGWLLKSQNEAALKSARHFSSREDSASAPLLTVDFTVPANLPPTVSITKPTGGETFSAPANVTIEASASDSDGSIAKVEFFDGATSLGIDTTSPFSINATLTVGSHSLTAVATDNLGARTTSAVVMVTVKNPPTPAHLTNPRTLTDGRFQFDVTGVAGSLYTIEAGVDPTNFSPIATQTAPSATFTFTDEQAAGIRRRFYRVRSDP